MLAPAKLQQLQALIDNSTSAEWLWMSGYLAALGTGTPEGQKTITPKAQDTITIVYGTETGNSKKVATQLTGRLKQQGHKTKLVAADQYKPELLQQESIFILAISTQGEGEPPANARQLYDYLHQSAQELPQLQYSIVALGSKSYPLFCQAGLDTNAQLKRLRAKPLVPIALCDDDFEPVAEAWIISVIQALEQQVPVSTASVVPTKTEGKKIFQATLGSNVLLNDKGSLKAVHHLEFDLSEEVLYTPGNAVGITPHNDAKLVQRLLQCLQIPLQRQLLYKQTSYTAEALFTKVVSIQYLTLGVVKKYAQLVQADIPDTRMDLYDLLRIYPLPGEYDVQVLIDILNPITPRLYTISSSPSAHTGQLHLTVARHAFAAPDGTANGFGSGYLTQLKPGTKLEVFLHQQKHFQLPRHDRHLIMIGQGTGIAPFRSMIAERDAAGASGHNWLLFGEDSFINDFYYQTEIQSWHETGSLHHVSLAFVQHSARPQLVHELVLAEAKRLWQWLELGAHLLISGEKQPMGTLVEEALLQIIADNKQVSAAEAATYLKNMAKEGRYAKELY